MLKYFWLMSTILVSFCATDTFAAEKKDAEVKNASQESADMLVEDNYNEWKIGRINRIISSCEAKNLDLNLPQCDFNNLYAYGDAEVKGKPNSYKWVDERLLAYKEALIDAYVKIALEKSRDRQVDTIREFIDDKAPIEADELKSASKMEELWDKAVALAGGKLDKKLEELGINPEQYNSAPKEKKKTLFKDAITVRSIAKTISDTSGMLPGQTFEGTDGDGNYSIRVVVAKDPEKIALVKSMLRNGSNISADPSKKSSKTIDEQVILPKEVLFSQLGTRLLYDKEGYPVLISFGQAGVEEKDVQGARRYSREVADNALNELLKSSQAFKSVVTQASSKAKEMKLVSKNDGVTEEVYEDVDYMRSLNETSKMTSQITDFAGVREIHNWRYKHPKLGLDIVGTVLMWSPKTAAYAKGLNVPASHYNLNNNHTPESAGVRRGIEFDDYDF